MRLRTKSTIGAALTALLALLGSHEAAQDVRIELEPSDICDQSSWFPIAIRPHMEGTGCVSSLDSGGFVWLNLPEERLRKVHLRATFLAPSPPLPGVTPYGLQQLDHLLIAYLFEQGSIAVAVIADNGEIPPPPSFVDGDILGRIAYGVPFEVVALTTTERHEILVSQDEQAIASAEVQKADPHADPLTYLSYFSAPGSIQGLDLEFGPVVFKGMKSNEGFGAFTFGPVLGSLTAERVGDAIRVVNH